MLKDGKDWHGLQTTNFRDTQNRDLATLSAASVTELTIKGKVCIWAKWLTRPELIAVSVAWSD